jgi:hypothetical protein
MNFSAFSFGSIHGACVRAKQTCAAAANKRLVCLSLTPTSKGKACAIFPSLSAFYPSLERQPPSVVERAYLIRLQIPVPDPNLLFTLLVILYVPLSEPLKLTLKAPVAEISPPVADLHEEQPTPLADCL